MTAFLRPAGSQEALLQLQPEELGRLVVRVSVEDGSRAWPRYHRAQPGDQDGRGMAIVSVLSRRTGCDSTVGGKVAWAELSA